MRPSLATRSVATLVSLVLQADLARAADFCTDLKAVIAQTKGSFVSLRGSQMGATEMQGSGWSRSRFQAKRVLAGASGCTITVDRSPPNETAAYECSFPPAPNLVATGDRLGHAVIDCVGDNDMDDGGINKQNDEIAIKLYGSGFYKITINSIQNPKHVLMSINAPL